MGERIAICTAQVPFLSGRAELHALNIKKALREHGHQADVVTLPVVPLPLPEAPLLHSIRGDTGMPSYAPAVSTF